MIQFDFDRKCYSCTACANVCSRGAISFDDRLLPIVDRDKCVDCGLCDKVCINLNPPGCSRQLPHSAKAWACKNINTEERLSSSSGGIFILLARYILNSGGYVCGCVYDEDLMPRHIVSDDFKIVSKMMGSKYVTSNMGNCIQEMKLLLENNKTVLFSGVPCEIAAVKAVLGDYKNLYFLGIVCHGTIDPSIWRYYLKSKSRSGNIVKVTMRDKSRGWLNYGLKLTFEDGSESIAYRYETGYFLKCYTDGLFERNRCLSCVYKGNNIYADILLGDGWGLDRYFKEPSNDGLSSVICLTEKGLKLFNGIDSKISKAAVDTKEIVGNNKRIISPAVKPALRDSFLHGIYKKPDNIEKLCRLYGKDTLIKRAVNKIHRIISR